jgi:pilus assembly protein CpaC
MLCRSLPSLRIALAAVLLAAPATGRAAAQNAPPAIPRIVMTAGRSSVLPSDFPITRIAVTNPDVADAVVVQPREVLIHGKAPGTVSLIIWGADDRKQYDLVVEPGVSILEQRLQALFPGEDIKVGTNDEALILSGRVSSNAVSLRAAEIAAATSSKAKVVNLLQLPGGNDSQQVLLQVRFAEVSRRALSELGVTFFTSALGISNTISRVGTQQFGGPGFEDISVSKNPDGTIASASGKNTFSDFLNLFFFNTRYDIGAVVRALQTRGLFQSLAEPNLIAYNGQEASFLAGGEIPIPIVQGISNAVSIQFKEYGIRLNFTPTIAGDTIRLKVRPEVSTLDFPNGIVLAGFRIPALSTRRAQTEVELRDGQSFAIAGLLDNVSQEEADGIPGLMNLPIIGHLFRSKASRSDRTELLVLITPQLVRPLNPDEVPPLPTIERKFFQPEGDIGDHLQGGAGVVDGPEVKNPKKGKRGQE